MKNQEKKIPVVAAIILRDNSVMIAYRKKELSHGGFWEFPGGKIKQNETPEKALIREIEEEFGAKFKPLKYIGFVTAVLPHVTIDLHAIVGYLTSGIRFMKDHDTIKWLQFDSLLQFELGAADALLLKKYGSEIQREIEREKPHEDIPF